MEGDLALDVLGRVDSHTRSSQEWRKAISVLNAILCEHTPHILHHCELTYSC
jgi:hypothetical protein